MQPKPPSWRDELRGPSSEAMRARVRLGHEDASQAPTPPLRRSEPYDAPQPLAPTDTLTTGAVHAGQHARASVSVSDGSTPQTATHTGTTPAAP